MKKLILSILIPALVAPSLVSARVSPVPTMAVQSVYHTVFHYNDVRKALRGVSITEAVLDGSIYPEIDRVHPFDRKDLSGSGVLTLTDEQAIIRAEKVKENRKRNGQAVQEHCRSDLRVTAPSNEGACGSGFRD